MTITFPLAWFRGRNSPAGDVHQQRLQITFERLCKSTSYGRDLEPHLANCWEAAPSIELTGFLEHTERYATVDAHVPAPETLQYPIGDAPRTAVVGRAVRTSWRIRSFKSLRDERLWNFKPHAIAAPADSLRRFACECGVRPLRNAVIAFTDLLQGPLASDDADRFWQSYQTPVFEQLLGFGGELLAWECEVHHGLHVRTEAAHFEQLSGERITVSFLANPKFPLLRLETGFTGRIAAEPCPCGDASPRLLELRRRETPRAALAATAGAVG